MAEITASVGRFAEITVKEVREDGSVVLLNHRWNPPEQVVHPGDRIWVVNSRISGIQRAEQPVPA